MKRLALYFLIGLAAAVSLYKLISHRSPEPLILGVYSLPYFVLLVIIAFATLFVAIVCLRYKRRALYIISTTVIVEIVLFLALAEVAVQIYAYFHPTCTVLMFKPDRVLGWKQVHNFSYIWTGRSRWYQREFSVPVKINSLGYRDLERDYQKPENVTRIAMIGDSLVEAIQVPLDKTAGYVLEEKLDGTARARSEGPGTYEVLNFGISNYGIGQYLLAWEEDVSQFEPDFVFAFIHGEGFARTVRKYYPGTFKGTDKKQLWIRPTFRLENGTLVREAAADYEEYVRAQNDLIRNGLGGKRMVRRQGFFLTDNLRRVRKILMSLQRRWTGSSAKGEGSWKPKEETFGVNFSILQKLGEEVAGSGARFIIVDATTYFEPGETGLPVIVQELCAKERFGYIDLSNRLLKAADNGVRIRWPRDGHFNEKGNEILADAMYRWLVENSNSSSK